MVIAILTVLSGLPFANPISDDCSRQKETDETAAWRRPMKNELKHHEKVFQIRTAWNLVANGVACGHEVCKNRLDGSAVHLVCVKALPSANSQIVRRREEVWRFHVDLEISCETQLLELVSLNSVVHLVSAVSVSVLLSACVLFS